jgi:hypothetical protein
LGEVTASSNSFLTRLIGRLTVIERAHRLGKAGVLVTAALLSACAPVAAQSGDPVTALQSRLELCEHIAGEEPYDAQRRAALTRAFQENCAQLSSDWRAMLALHPPPDPIGEQLQGLRTRVEQFPP